MSVRSIARTVAIVAAALAACGEAHESNDGGSVGGADAGVDGATRDAAGTDAATARDGGGVIVDDAGPDDAGPDDASAPEDAAATDAGPPWEGFPLHPPPMPTYSRGVCPTLVGGPDVESSHVTGFQTGEQTREFRLVVPPSYDGSRAFPLVFGWHWLNSRSDDIFEDAEIQSATEQLDFIAVLPDALRDEHGDRVYRFSWPFIEGGPGGREADEQFFADLLACVTSQYNIDRDRIYGMGVSAGGLWLGYLSTTPYGNYFAAVLSLSGGLGRDPTGTWEIPYVPQPQKFPALVLWGGVTDFLILSFEQTSKRYRDALIADGHFVVTCTHSSGHAVPPIEPPPGGGTRFSFLWQFALDHPYGLAAGSSPWQTSGLPAGSPDWCRIATP